MSRHRNAEEFSTRGLLQQLGEKWTVPVLSLLSQRRWRFYELRDRLGIASNMLSRTLRALERNGLLSRFESPTQERQVEYELTSLGVKLHELATVCDEWTRRHERAIADARQVFDRRRRPRRNQPNTDPDLPPRQRVPASVGTLPMAMNHIAIVVRDIEAAAARYADVFDIRAPTILTCPTDLPDGTKVPTRSCWVAFGNFWVNLIESERDVPAFRRYFSKYGQGVYQIGFDVAKGVQSGIQALERRGAERLMGAPSDPYAQFDFRAGMGTAVELIDVACAFRQMSAGNDIGCVGGSRTVSTVTIAVPDIVKASRLYLSVLGLRMSRTRPADFCYPSARGTQRGRVQMGTIRHNGLAINLVQPLAASPLQRVVDRTGGAVHHIGFCVQDSLERAVADLERKGGRILLGDPTKDYVQMDFTEQLGMVIALTRTERPHS